jgi:hypothetical protein
MLGAGTPGAPRLPDPIPDDIGWIIESEIRKQLRAVERDGELPFELSSDAGERRSIQRAHDPSRPILCDGLAAVARQSARPGKFHGLIRDGCGMLVADGALRERRRGRKWVLDPGWLFREVYMRERTCEAIAAETGHPVRNVVEAIRRISHRLQERLLAALALSPEVVTAVVAKTRVRERVREQVLDALQAFVAGEATDDPGADDVPSRIA